MGLVNRVRVCFRFDDPKGSSDHALEARVLDVFRHFGFPLTVAVVPFSPQGNHYVALRRQDVPHLTEAHEGGRIEVALHGYQHKAISRDPRDIPSEFYGIASHQQSAMMREGKAVLEAVFGAAVQGFVPPWNTHDESTLDAASALGFSWLGCGVQRGGRTRHPVVIPKTCSMRLDSARAALASASRYRDRDPVLIFVFHPDNFAEFRSPPGPGEGPPHLSIPKLEQILKNLASQPEHLSVSTLGDVAGFLESNKKLWTAADFDFLESISWRFRNRLPVGFLSGRSKWGVIRAAIRDSR